MEIYHPRDEELLREMKRVRRSDRRRRLCRGLIILLTLSIAVGLFVFLRYYQLAVAHGTGMGDTLPEGSLLLIRKPEAGQTYQAGDVILYSGNQIVLFYGSNTWSYTRIGKMQYESLDELKSFLKAGEGNISVTLSL